MDESKSELDRLLSAREATRARRAELADRIKRYGRCHGKESWSRYQELLADMAIVKARLKKENVQVDALQKAQARALQEAGALPPKVSRAPKVPGAPRTPLTTGEVLLRAARRMVKTLERLRDPLDFDLEFLPHLRTFVTHQEEHVAWQRRAWEDRDREVMQAVGTDAPRTAAATLAREGRR
jgi:hypothetical protein